MTYPLTTLTLELSKLETELRQLRESESWHKKGLRESYITDYERQISELRQGIEILETYRDRKMYDIEIQTSFEEEDLSPTRK